MPIFLTVYQIHDLLEIARRCSPRDYALFRLMANTGLRESDILSLKRQQVLTKSGEVVKNLTVKMKKTGKAVDKEHRKHKRGFPKSFPCRIVLGFPFRF